MIYRHISTINPGPGVLAGPTDDIPGLRRGCMETRADAMELRSPGMGAMHGVIGCMWV